MNDLYLKQKAFFDKIAVEYGDKSYIDKIKDYCIGINKNVSDVIGTLDWDHSKEPKANSKLHQKIETTDAAIDIMKYAMNLCIEYDVSVEELMQRFDMKNRTVEQKLRQRQFLRSDKFKDSSYAFIIDIDGVIADIYTSYKWFFSKKLNWHQTYFTWETFEDWKTKNIDRYKELKEEYRLCGCKMIMPAIDNARDLLRHCHSKGVVSLLTNRPVKSYPILYMYTVEWLYTRGMIQWVDMIHFTELGEKKYFFDRFNGKEVYFFEDNVYNLINIAERPNVCNVFVQNETNKHIKGVSVHETHHAVPVANLNEAIAFIKDMTDDKDNYDLPDSISSTAN